MASGWKSLKKAANNSAVALGTGNAKILQISTVGNSGTVYLGGSDVNGTSGCAILKDMVLDWGSINSLEEELDLAKLYVFSASTDGVSILYVDRS